MSNTQVGSVYLKIIDEVIDGSATTFEEEGVEKALLEDLKKTWQQKLTERHVAAMPWDPAPQMNNSPASLSVAVKQEPQIKHDPGPYPANYDASQAAAAARAAQNIQEKYGSDVAGPQIAQLRAQAQMAQKPNPTQGQMSSAQQQYKQQLAASQMNQQRAGNNTQGLTTPQQRASVTNAQTDGPSGWDATLLQRRAVSDESSKIAETTIRQRIQQTVLEIEGGGLMLTASERKAKLRPRHRTAKKSTTTAAISQLDGPDDDEIKADPDEDAINSDLDDPDDDAIAETEDDPSTGELMLCTYDKVQRVKNKWKCTLKDGVLTTGGKEYIFGKANGEFEW